MTTWAVLATGPSMNQSVADAVRSRCNVVVVSDAYKLAPWADALVSADSAWWDAHPDALQFAGKRYGLVPQWIDLRGIERLSAPQGTNSGLLAVMVAAGLGAKKIVLLGCDMHSPGDHFFGRHAHGLKSTTQERMEVFKRQFASYKPRGIEIVNCTPGSALTCYPKANLEDVL